MEDLVAHPSEKFWHSRRVFITGHTGFKGSWLSLWLQHFGARLTGYSLPAPTNPSLYETARVGDGMTSIVGDVRDTSAVAQAISKHQPEIVFHMAAQPLVRRSYEEPLETYAVNVLGTAGVLEAVRHTPTVRAVVIVTTDKCYENHGWVWGYRETDPLGGYDPYSSSKACAELVTAAYRRSFFNPAEYVRHHTAIASVRAGNAVGGGDWATDRLLPDLFRALIAREPAIIRHPRAVRPWQHVLEPLAGYLEVARRLFTDGPAFAEAWNFGPSEEDAKPVSWIAERLVTLWGGSASWSLDGDGHPHEAAYLRLDNAKARARLNWRPVWNLETALEKSVEWYQGFRDGADMQALTLAQIAEYVSSAEESAKANYESSRNS